MRNAKMKLQEDGTARIPRARESRISQFSSGILKE